MIKSVVQAIRNNSKTKTLIQTRNAATTAGLALLGMSLLAPIAYTGILENLPQSNVFATLEHITNLKMEIVLAILILSIVVALDGIVAVSLIKFLKPSKQRLIGLMGWTRIIYAAIFLIAIAFLVAVVIRVGDATSTVSPLAIGDLKGFSVVRDIALVLLGIHLLLLGWIFYKTKYTPTWLGVLLAIAGVGYLIDSFGTYLISGYAFEISNITFIGEGLLIVWLLIWGRRLNSSDIKVR